MSLKICIISSLFLMSSMCQAAYQCDVTVLRVLVYNSGDVNILHSGRGDYTNICNLKSERQGVGITTCAMWTSMLQSIKKQGGKAAFYFSGDGSCSTLPTYSASPAPVYIGVI